MNVLWVFHSGEIGGAPLTGIEALQGLHHLGHRVLGVVPSKGGVANALSAHGIEYVVIPHTRWVRHKDVRDRWLRWRRLPRTLRAAFAIARLVRSRAIDVVVTSTLTFPAAALGAMRASVPHVWFIQEFGFEDFGSRFDWGEARSLGAIERWSRRVVVHSPAVLERFRDGIAEDKLTLVTAGVDVPPLERESVRHQDGPFRVILVGSLLPVKGQREALEAIALLTQRGRDVRLDLVGSGPPEEREALETRARGLGIEERVSFLGFRDDRLDLVAAADVALMCSQSEALGRVTIEAMKIGTPVVASASGVNPYLIDDGQTGLLYTAGDPVDLAAKVESLIDDPGRAAAIGRRGMEWARARFSVERLGAEFERVLVEATGTA